MEKKIKIILERARDGVEPLEELEQELLNLHSVSQKRELLLAFLEYVQETNSDNETIIDNKEFVKGFLSQL